MIRLRVRLVLLPLGIFLLCGCGNGGWQSVETDRLIIHYKKDSFAEKNLAEVVADYEDSIRAAERLLPQVRLEGKVKVYLHEHLEKLGYARAAAREVHFRYDREFRLTSMHEFLHIFLHRLNPQVPLRFDEGVCRVHEVRTVRAGSGAVQVPLVQLGKRAAPSMWRLDQIFLDHYSSDEEGNLAAAFVAFAMQEHGEGPFWNFYGSLRKREWRPAIENYFGQDIHTVEARFVNFMKRIPDPPGA